MSTVYEFNSPPIKNSGFTFYMSLVSQADTDIFQVNPTLASGDVKIIKDGTLDGNIDALPTAVTSITQIIAVTLSSDEMNANSVCVVFKDAADNEWQDALIEIKTVVATTVSDGTGITLADAAITAAKIDTGAIDADAIAADAIGASELAAGAVAEIADGVWDEVLTSASHDVGYSAGQRLRYQILTGAVAQAGAASSITLAATESATDNIFSENIISIVGGLGAGQTRLIAEYDGTTKIAIVDKAWLITPNNTSVYEILPFSSIILSDHGTAQAGAAGSITLATTASATNNTYIGSVVYISSGTGSGQIRLITAYNGTTKVATVSDNWTTTPDNTSIYKVLPVGRIIVDSVKADAINASALAADAVTEIAAGVLTVAMTESYAADGAAPTLAQAVFAIQQFLQERAVSSTTLTVKKLDGSATAMTFTLDDASEPTSITRAT